MKIDKLPKLKARLLELRAKQIRPTDEAFKSNNPDHIGYDFKAYEIAYDANWSNIVCVKLAIEQIETELKIARAYSFL